MHHKPEVSPGSGHTRQANTPFHIRNPGLRRMYGFIICGHTWSSLPSNYRIQGNCVEVRRSFGILSFLSVKNKIEKQVQERYFRFQKSEQSHGNEEQHVNDVCKCAKVCLSLCFINESLSMCVGI